MFFGYCLHPVSNWLEEEICLEASYQLTYIRYLRLLATIMNAAVANSRREREEARVERERKDNIVQL